MKRYRKLFVTGIFILLCVMGFLGFQWYGKYSESHRAELITELTEKLNKAITDFQNRTVTLQINGDTHTYSTKQLNTHIYFKTSDGVTYEVEDAEKLATTVFESNPYISDEEIRSFVQCESNATALQKLAKELSSKHDTKPKNAYINRKGKVVKAKRGHVLDTTAICKKLDAYLNSETTENYSASYDTSTMEPEWTTEEIKNVNTIITGFSTSFVSSTPRGTNIKIAASRLNNRFLLPDDTISFLDVLYQDDDGKDYKTSNGFLDGKVVPAKGGGICQVSTTAYGAFLFAGIIPEKRYPHSMTVSYSPIALDAALSVGGKDLKIKNTLDVPLLIKAKTNGNRLTVRLVSYKNALNGYRYQPRSVKISDTKGKAYLDVYKNKKKIKTIFLSKDKYLG